MARLSKDAKVGYEAAGKTKTLTSWRTWLFSGGWPMFTGWPHKNIHTDLEFALNCGVPARIASGSMMTGYLYEMMIDLFGPDWLKGGKMSLKFIKGAKIGDKVTAKGVIQSKEIRGSEARISMDVWCENQEGEKLVVGAGMGLLK